MRFRSALLTSKKRVWPTTLTAGDVLAQFLAPVTVSPRGETRNPFTVRADWRADFSRALALSLWHPICKKNASASGFALSHESTPRLGGESTKRYLHSRRKRGRRPAFDKPCIIHPCTSLSTSLSPLFFSCFAIPSACTEADGAITAARVFFSRLVRG